MTAHAERTATTTVKAERERAAPVETVRRAPDAEPGAMASASEMSMGAEALMAAPSAVGGPRPATRIRRSATAADLEHTPEDITSRIRQAPAGRPLEAPVQRRLEGALDTSLANVRVHADGASDSMAKDINARAFATGSDIFFGSGEYRPNDAAGFETIAHEVVHTTQQSSAGSGGTRIGRMHLSDPSDHDEREASSIASKIVSDGAAPAAHEVGSAPATVQRQVSGSTRIRRLGAATRLRGIDDHYDAEETVQRPDLRGVVLGFGEVVAATWNAMQALPGANDPAALSIAKDLLNTCAGLALIRARVEPMDKGAALAEITKIHDVQLEKAQKQDIVIDAQGNVDMGALNARLVEYDRGSGAQRATLVSVSGGRLKRSTTHAQAGLPVDTAESVTQHSGKGWEIFVVGASGDIHMAPHKIGKYHHSSLLAGAPVSMAGEMKVSGGKVVTMSNKSGHYSPTPQHFQHFLRSMEGTIALDFNVVGFGVANGRADAWLLALADGDTPEFLDNDTIIRSLALEGKHVEPYLVSPPPGGLGWQRRPAVGSQFDKPDGSGGWKPVGHEEFRRAVEAKFGKAKKQVERKVGGTPSVSWL